MGRSGVGGAPPALAARGISKRFGATRALDGVDVTVLAGEVHGLVGANGSGKSTLIRILAGYHAPEPGGALAVGGRVVRLPLRPGEPRRLGMGFVHQDLGLIPSVSVLENLRLGDLAARRGLRISWTSEVRHALAALAGYGVDLDPLAPASTLAPVERALVAIVRAAEDLRAGETRTRGRHGPRTGGVLVLDEPTAFLPRQESERLFSQVRRLVAEGAGVLFVSHDLEEVCRVTDRVTVLRDGRWLGTLATRGLATEDLAELVTGRRLGPWRPRPVPPPKAAPGISVAGLSGRVVRDVTLHAHRGEIVGLTGLAGSGFDEVTRLLYGTPAPAGGRLVLGDATFDLTRITPVAARRAGMALVPADRHRDGAVGSLTVAENVTLPVLEGYTAAGRLRHRRLQAGAAALLARFDVRPADPGLPYAALSGGNQQKALVGKWLGTQPRVLLLDEPTRGVDAGARQRIFAMVSGAAGNGAAVLLASSDYEQLAAVCDRVLVFAGGRVAAQLAGDEVDEGRIAGACSKLSS